MSWIPCNHFLLRRVVGVMNLPEGGFSGVLSEYADAIAGDGTVTGGRVLTVEEFYRQALCPG